MSDLTRLCPGDGKSTGGEGVSDLFDAYQLVQDYVGQGEHARGLSFRT